MNPKAKKNYVNTHNFIFNTLIVGDKANFEDDLKILITYTEDWIKKHRAKRWWNICGNNVFVFLTYCLAEDAIVFIRTSKKFEEMSESIVPHLSQDEIAQMTLRLFPNYKPDPEDEPPPFPSDYKPLRTFHSIGEAKQAYS